MESIRCVILDRRGLIPLYTYLVSIMLATLVDLRDTEIVSTINGYIDAAFASSAVYGSTALGILCFHWTPPSTNSLMS